MSPREAAKHATAEIGLAVMATTLSLVVIFVPVSFMSSVAGRFLYQFGITASVAVLVSLFVSFTLTPAQYARYEAMFERARKVGHRESREELFLAAWEMLTRVELAEDLSRVGTPGILTRGGQASGQMLTRGNIGAEAAAMKHAIETARNARKRRDDHRVARFDNLVARKLHRRFGDLRNCRRRARPLSPWPCWPSSSRCSNSSAWTRVPY